MIENIKVDIVYYLTATDFEFEFNLGGCCHMRLLNDKVNDKKGFVNSLARAVSRSQIVITCGPLFGQDGLISVCAAAINHCLKTVDNKAYGIASDDKIEIIDGAVPLVTGEGYFGGCIIESGNQSIIVLTENRTIRKSIMKTLVHPYIEDMCIMQSAERAGSGAIGDIRPNADIKPVNESETEPALVQEEEEHIPDNTATYETEPTEPETQPQETVSAETADGEHNIEFDFSEPGGEDGELPDDEPEEVAESDDSDIFETEDRDVDRKEKGKGINATILIVFAFLLLVLLGLCFFLVFLPMINGVSTVEYFKQIFSTVSGVGSV